MVNVVKQAVSPPFTQMKMNVLTNIGNNLCRGIELKPRFLGKSPATEQGTYV